MQEVEVVLVPEEEQLGPHLYARVLFPPLDPSPAHSTQLH